MAWMESHQSLGDHPKTIRAAHTLRIDTPQMVGHLHYLWWWALDYAQDGDLSSFSAVEIAHAARWKKKPDDLLNALTTCGRPGFLDVTESGLQIHDWGNYGGKLLEKRRKDSARHTGSSTEVPRKPDGIRKELTGTVHTVHTVEGETAPVVAAIRPRRREITEDVIKDLQEQYPSVDVRAAAADYLNWTGSSKHTDKVLGLTNQLKSPAVCARFPTSKAAGGRPPAGSRLGTATDAWALPTVEELYGVKKP